MVDHGSPRFSVLLPTHNRADVLAVAIRSVLWQSTADFELLIAGDGCTDATKDVIASFTDSRIRWFDLPKAPGVGYANRNVALRQARGHYIAYLSHDDLWFPDHLERLGALLDQTGAELTYSRLLAVDLDGRIRPSSYNLEIPSHCAGLWRGDIAITISAVMHTRACLVKYGEWNETLLHHADVELWHRFLTRGRFRNVAFFSEPTALHFVANWRRTDRQAARRITRWLVDGLLDETLPQALLLPVVEREPQQHTAWRYLSAQPDERVSLIRRAVVQFQDAVLWKARTAPSFAGLRAGLFLGGLLDRLSRRITWMASRQTRDRHRRLEAMTRAFEENASAETPAGVG